jgi:general secretion pathway protein L
MAKLFLFFNSITDDTINSIVVEDNGKISHPLLMRTLDEIKHLNQDIPITIVLPSWHALILSVELPINNQAKLRQAIPYALEEQLTGELTSNHFCIDKAFKEGNNHLVVITSKDMIASIISWCNENLFNHHAITIDYFALNPQQAMIGPEQILLNTSQYKGAIKTELFHQIQQSIQSKTISFLNFTDSNKNMTIDDTKSHQESYFDYVAKSLVEKPHMNLIQGDFKQNTMKSKPLRTWMVAASLISLSIILYFSSLFTQYLWLSRQHKNLHEQVLYYYKEFFPNSTQLVRPKFRINQALKKIAQGANQPNLFKLLYQISTATPHIRTHITQLQYSKERLNLILVVSDFEQLALIQAQFKKHGLKVKQNNAVSNEGNVKATLELTL